MAARSPGVSQTSVITAVRAEASTGRASVGPATVTRPAPTRNAPRAQSRAAPVRAIGPDTTRACPRAYLCPASPGRGGTPAHEAGAFRLVADRIWSSTVAGMPISASSRRPQRSLPGSRMWPGFRRKKVMVSLATTAAPRTAPVPPSTPEGTSIDRIGRPVPFAHAFTRSIVVRAAPATSRARPAPKRASTTRSVARSSAAMASGAARSMTGPLQSAAAPAASPLRVDRATSEAKATSHPAWTSRRAAT